MNKNLRCKMVSVFTGLGLLIGSSVNAAPAQNPVESINYMQFADIHQHHHNRGPFFGGGSRHHGLTVNFGAPRHQFGFSNYGYRTYHPNYYPNIYRGGYGYSDYGYRYRHHHRNDAAVVFGSLLGAMAYQNSRPVFRCRAIVNGQWRVGRTDWNGPCLIRYHGRTIAVHNFYR